eukprot:754070-Hanusia_phi.AAC.1
MGKGSKCSFISGHLFPTNALSCAALSQWRQPKFRVGAFAASDFLRFPQEVPAAAQPGGTPAARGPGSDSGPRRDRPARSDRNPGRATSPGPAIPESGREASRRLQTEAEPITESISHK